MIRVNDTQIPEDRVYSQMQYHPADSREEAMHQAATTLVIGEVLKDRARALKLNVADEGAEASEDDFIEQLIEREVDYPEASTDECRHYFEANPERFVTSPLLDVRHILIAADPEDQEQRLKALQLAERILSEIAHSDRAFSRLAEQYSACSSSEAGGALGQLGRGQTVPEFERPVFAAPEGLMQHPVETRYGFHVVQIDHRAEGKPLEFDMVHDQIREYLNEKVRRKAISQYLTTLLAEAEIEGIDIDVSKSPLMQ